MKHAFLRTLAAASLVAAAGSAQAALVISDNFMTLTPASGQGTDLANMTIDNTAGDGMRYSSGSETVGAVGRRIGVNILPGGVGSAPAFANIFIDANAARLRANSDSGVTATWALEYTGASLLGTGGVFAFDVVGNPGGTDFTNNNYSVNFSLTSRGTPIAGASTTVSNAPATVAWNVGNVPFDQLTLNINATGPAVDVVLSSLRYNSNAAPAAVPAPAPMALMGLGLIALGALRRRRV